MKSENDELLKSKLALEKRLKKFTSFAKEKKRYELRELCDGVTVFATKEIHKGEESPHYICPNCYQKERKSILQLRAREFDGAYFECKNPQCKAVFINHDDRRMPFL